MLVSWAIMLDEMLGGHFEREESLLRFIAKPMFSNATEAVHHTRTPRDDQVRTLQDRRGLYQLL